MKHSHFIKIFRSENFNERDFFPDAVAFLRSRLFRLTEVLRHKSRLYLASFD